MECLFCKIASHKIPAKVRFENKEIIAFDDINPKAKIHLLIIPKKHIPSVAAITESDRNTICNLIYTARDIAESLGVAKSGYRLVFNSGRDAGQEIDHIHLHLLAGSKLGSIA